jgi:hypothetical protein
MSVSNRFLEKLKTRGNWIEILYYAERSEFNATRSQFPLEFTPEQIQDDREQCRDNAHRLYDLLDQLSREAKTC